MLTDSKTAQARSTVRPQSSGTKTPLNTSASFLPATRHLKNWTPECLCHFHFDPALPHGSVRLTFGPARA